MSKLQVAFITGVPDSAYSINAEGVKKFMPEVDVSIFNAYEIQHFNPCLYDRVFVLSWWMGNIGSLADGWKRMPARKYKISVIVGSHTHTRKGLAGLLRDYDAVFGVSDRLVCELNEQGLEARFLTWFYDEKNFYPLDKKINDNVFKVGWVGNCERPCKRYDIFKKLAQKLMKDSRFKAKVAALNITKGDRLCSDRDIKQNEMGDFYRSLDCFIVTSEHEGQPKTAIEASLCGVPVVSTDVGMCRELGAFILSEPLTVEALVVMVKRMRKKRQWSDLMGKAAYVKAKEIWGTEVVREQWKTILEL